MAHWAKNLQRDYFSNSVVLYSAYAFSQIPEIEMTEKSLFFPEGRYVGQVNNAVHEAEAFVRATESTADHTPVVLIVTDAWLSRSMKLAFESRLWAQNKKANVDVHLCSDRISVVGRWSNKSPSFVPIVGVLESSAAFHHGDAGREVALTVWWIPSADYKMIAQPVS